MQLVTEPETFDVLVMENTFGDILSDVAAGVTGGLGLAASASLGDRRPGHLRAGARLGARHRRHRRREPDRRCCARSRSLLEHALGEPELARSLDGGRRRRARLDARRRTSAAPRRRPRSATAVLAALAAGGGRVTALVGYPGPGGQPQRGGVAPARAADSTTEPLPSFIAVVEAAVAADVALGVLPIENSLHGPVAETHDLLYEAPLSIVSEVTLPIVHCLVAQDADPASTRSGRFARTRRRSTSAATSSTRSAPAACPSATTADAAREVAESDDPTEAAIASDEAARASACT